jgi:ATPase subunit of ABC transporter with duplicated ATPase domains
MRTVAQTSSTMVSVIGPMGQGKSTAINGILNREICIANSKGSSVTQVPTIYEYLESITEDENQTINATVHFKSPEIIDLTTKTFYNHLKEMNFPEDTGEDDG